MPLNFKSQLGSVVDQGTGMIIYPPRMLDASSQENSDHIEYQYMLYRGDELIGGLGCFGDDMMMERSGRKERVFTLDLDRDWVLDSIFRLKKKLNNGDDDFTFLQELAHGLVAVFENSSRVAYSMRYIVLTKQAILAERGIAVPYGVKLVPPDITPLVQGKILLAEAIVPARTLPGISS